MKKIMILGAGVYQVPLIQKAKDNGYHVIVVSYPGNYPGFELADQIIYEDTTNAEKITEAAKRERIDAIATTGTDVAIKSLASVCDALNIPGISKEAGKILCDKSLIKSELKDVIRMPRSEKVYFDSDLSGFDKRSYPLMIKAVDSSGSRGITVCTKPEMIREAIEAARKVSKKDYFLAEQFLDGKEIGCEAIIANGKVDVLIPHEKILFHGPTDVPIGHIFNIPFSKDVLDDLKKQLNRLAEKLNLQNCVLNMDIIIQNNIPYIIDIGARCGATGIPEGIRKAADQDMYQAILDLAAGTYALEEKDWQMKRYALSQLLYTDKTGTIENIIIKGSIPVAAEDLQIDVKPGDAVDAFQTGPDRLGQFVISSEDYDQLLKLQEEVNSDIIFEVKE